MPITAREPESNLGPQPPAGVCSAVCVDVIDRGMVENRFDPEKGPTHQVRIVWQLSKKTAEGKPYLIRRDFTLSLHEKSSLRKELESWRGVPFTREELAGFDVEKVIGISCMLNIVHKMGSKGDKTFANVGAILPLYDGVPKLLPTGDYVREQDRTAPTAQPEPHGPITDEDLPF